MLTMAGRTIAYFNLPLLEAVLVIDVEDVDLVDVLHRAVLGLMACFLAKVGGFPLNFQGMHSSNMITWVWRKFVWIFHWVYPGRFLFSIQAVAYLL